jgi:hypothetical protein
MVKDVSVVGKTNRQIATCVTLKRKVKVAYLKYKKGNGISLSGQIL